MCKSSKLVTKKLKKEVESMATYTEGNKTFEVERVANLSKAEVRLFFYFLIKRRSGIPDEKVEEFQESKEKMLSVLEKHILNIILFM